MTEIEQKAVEEMADRIGKFYNYQITQSDTYELAKFLYIAGYRKQSETITFYKDPNIKDWAESEYAWCERPCDSNMSMRAIDKKGNIVGYASEHYWTWCDVKEVKKVSAREYMGHFASKQSDTVKEFAEKAEQRFREDSKWLDIMLKGYDCKDSEDYDAVASAIIRGRFVNSLNDLAAQYDKEEE